MQTEALEATAHSAEIREGYRKNIMTLTLAQANRAIEAALAKARELGSKVSVSVCDNAGHLIAHQRMDGVLSVATRASIGKAMVAAAFGVPSGNPPPTADLLSTPGILPNNVPAWPTPGGFPIRFMDKIQGAIGVAGASTEDDENCAQAGLKAIDRYPDLAGPA